MGRGSGGVQGPLTAPSLRFRSFREDTPGAGWLARFRENWPTYHAWFLTEGDAARPDLETCRIMLRRHMPELVPLWERLVSLVGGDPMAARMLSLYRPSPYLAGCSQAVWTQGKPALVRNYDYTPAAFDGNVALTAWTGTRVLGTEDCLWGLLDGVNEHGLCVALAFGGRHAVGEGFGIPLLIRYALEVCRTVSDAVRVLCAVPCHMPYNVSLVDASEDFAVVYLGPDRASTVRRARVATNHQPEWDYTPRDRVMGSEERERFLVERVGDPRYDLDQFAGLFLAPPLYHTDYAGAFGTLYSLRLEPVRRKATYFWPGESWVLGLDGFREEERMVEFRQVAQEG